MYIHKGEDLYLAADQETVVPEGDPRAAFVLVARGGSLPEDVARKHGLIDDEKAKAAPANKLRALVAENKGELQPRELAPGEMLEAGELPAESEAEVTFTPAPAFEEAVKEEPAPRRRGRAAE